MGATCSWGVEAAPRPATLCSSSPKMQPSDHRSMALVYPPLDRTTWKRQTAVSVMQDSSIEQQVIPCTNAPVTTGRLHLYTLLLQEPPEKAVSILQNNSSPHAMPCKDCKQHAILQQFKHSHILFGRSKEAGAHNSAPSMPVPDKTQTLPALLS